MHAIIIIITVLLMVSWVYPENGGPDLPVCSMPTLFAYAF